MYYQQFKMLFGTKIEYMKDLSDMQIERVKSVDNIAIYGAGKKAKEIAEIMDVFGKEIKCYLISDDRTGRLNPTYVYGVKVLPLSEAVYLNRDTLIIVTVGEKSIDIVKDKLRKEGFYNIIEL